MASIPTTFLLGRTPQRVPIAATAQGLYITLTDGTVLLDAVGGAAVSCIGNGHPEVIKAIHEQATRVSYVYSMQLSCEPAEELAKVLIDSSNGAFALCGIVSGGTEAMESVVKLARQYYFDTDQPQRTNFIARQISFHGNSLGTLSLAHHTARKLPYQSILNQQQFHHVSPAYAKRFQRPDETEAEYVERLRHELEEKFIELGPDTVIGFVAETVGGAATGVLSAPKGYFPAMKSVCEKYGALFILDEVMCGMGRMGTFHAWESHGDGAAPDIQAVAKGLGGGYASIGAVLMNQRVADGIRDRNGFWKHGHTYQSHPLNCAAALAVQKVIVEENLLENIRIQGQYLKELLEKGLTSPNALAAPFVFDIRGSGGFWGIEFDFKVPEASKLDFKNAKFAMLVQSAAMEDKLIIMGMIGNANIAGTEGDLIILAPAYNIQKKETELIAERLVASIEKVLRNATI